MMLPVDQLAYFDIKTHRFAVEPGPVAVLVGSSSDDILLRGSLEVMSGR
jgi:hypothetical protein